MKKPWYKSWFDTAYYHKLYAHRDENEAAGFIDNLVNELKMPAGSKVLDLACGRGRHAVYLHDHGYEVTGIDLSPRNIRYAQKYAEEGLEFEIGDMRRDLGMDRFDYIFNLFTSFGYFNDRQENLHACEAVARALKPKGTFILDFMNVNKVILGLVEKEMRVQEGITFNIERSIRDNMVIKTIKFRDGGEDFLFEEKVQLLRLEDFQELFDAAGMKINDIFGDFQLQAFDPRNSERLILFASHK